MSRVISLNTKVARRFALASFSAALYMGASHQAMAANVNCVASATAGITLDCSGVSSVSGTVTNTGTNPVITNDNGNAAISLAAGSSFTNFGDIDVSMAAAPNNTANTNGYQRTRLYGVSGADEGDYQVFNEGTISVTHTGVGRLWGVAANGDTTSMETTNDGTIQITRGPITLGTVSATSLTARASSLAPGNEANLDVAAAVYSEEEVASEKVTNNAGATISATGTLTAGIYSRAGEAVIVNDGDITQTTPTQGFAIAKVSDSGEIRTLDLTNNGTITGDILAVDGQAQRWWALSNGLGGTIDARLNINSQFGQVDSTIDNTGTINGNFYYSNGTHVLTNEAGATITGNIDVDQRPIVITGRTCTVGSDGCFASATTTGDTALGNPSADPDAASMNASTLITTGATSGHTTTYSYTLWGSKDFTFENAGVMTGDLTVETAPATTINGYSVPDSSVKLLPHVFGGGGASADTATGAGTIGTIDGTLKVADGIVNGAGGTTSLERTTTVSPIIDGTVKNGEWYALATQLYGTAANTELDDLTVNGTALVSWSAQTNASGALVIGSTVKDASQVQGISNPGAAAINALIAAGSSNSALGGAVENLTDDASVAKAGAQLAPETNFATQQTAITLNNAVGQHIDTRLASVGSTGGPATYMPGPSGLGMKPSDANRSNLGGSFKDEPEFVAPRSAALWAQAFGAGLDQDKRDLVDGYNARLYGILAGYDNWISPGFRVGIAGGYANTNIDGKGDTRQNETGIDSYLVEAYASLKGSGWYATGRTGFTWHNYDTTRVLTVPFTDSAKGSHDGTQYNAAIELGAPMRMVGAVLTPIASVTYSHLDQDAYTETSGAGMALSVASQSNDSVVSGLGLKAIVPIANDTMLEGRAVWLHEFSDTSQVVTASFAAGGGTFTAAGPNVGRDSADLGAGLVAQIDQGMSFEMNYDANVREDFLAHIGSARLNVNF